MDPSYGLKHLFKILKMFAKKKKKNSVLLARQISNQPHGSIFANRHGPDDLMKSKPRIRIRKNSDLSAFECAMMLLADGLV